MEAFHGLRPALVCRICTGVGPSPRRLWLRPAVRFRRPGRGRPDAGGEGASCESTSASRSADMEDPRDPQRSEKRTSSTGTWPGNRSGGSARAVEPGEEAAKRGGVEPGEGGDIDRPSQPREAASLLPACGTRCAVANALPAPSQLTKAVPVTAGGPIGFTAPDCHGVWSHRPGMGSPSVRVAAGIAITSEPVMSSQPVVDPDCCFFCTSTNSAFPRPSRTGSFTALPF